LYVLATINYELGQYESGLKLVRKAIEVSDDHTIKHYYLKANLKLMLGMVAEAISDFSNAILVMVEQESLK
jgi:tetratricopeptide (TPR) repeat protein